MIVNVPHYTHRKAPDSKELPSTKGSGTLEEPCADCVFCSDGGSFLMFTLTLEPTYLSAEANFFWLRFRER